ncbi:alpha/beta hydrolase [Pseudomonas sp. JS3066]|jgi:acetyl esterase|uniref:alpha/beta hydrolase n=1 Tax=unclassified Pseudomonas TaxID=196821 RepID=UPI000EA89097|nr:MULTISPECIES: alpha/beta hydrolase [unclassified Pseudomonas]AYF88116.1 alpha/beta hydrolase [Pseudomonas sp. DY-1]MDH4654424.1 alpha/beta hydrolase [Pseudomonas sp. BN606]MRK24278.1 alpha/beta hydrolase [Pseudomonas sp. JG-B]WVK94308.1 alpha/beta hydrolase [Pseudomonas sp. JS3066]
MPLDPQIAAVLQQFSGMPQPDYSQLDPVQYRQFCDNLMPPIPGERLFEVRNLGLAGAEGELDARLYRPEDRDDLPLLVFFHGGGFVIGNLDTHDNLCRSLARLCNAVVVSVAYRLAPESRFPAAPYDCYRATCDLVERARELGFDASRLALAGDSAGANLAIAVSRLAQIRKGPRIAWQCLFYPATDARCDSASHAAFAEGFFLTREQMRWFWSQYLPRAELVDDALASPVRAEDLVGLPPTTLISAEYDPLRDEGEAFAQRLQQAGVQVRMERCEGMIHGFISMAAFVGRAQAALESACADLRRALN